jgi:adenosylcobinamide-GDP ribazoletransferase
MSAEPLPPAEPQPPRSSPLLDFLTALQFLTISPPFIRRLFTPAELGRSVAYYPLVGALLGLALLLANLLLGYAFPGQLRAALLLALWVILTGALHLDGFLDTCDGLLGGFTPEQRMTIMRDERVGAYALAGGILLYLIKFSALTALHTPAGLLLAPTLGRWGIAMALVAYPYARPSGLGRDMKDHATRRQAILATIFALLVVPLAAWLGAGWSSLLAFAGAALVTWGAARFTLRRIPGLTGDIYGALNELVETSVLVLLALRIGW